MEYEYGFSVVFVEYAVSDYIQVSKVLNIEAAPMQELNSPFFSLKCAYPTPTASSPVSQSFRF